MCFRFYPGYSWVLSRSRAQLGLHLGKTGEVEALRRLLAATKTGTGEVERCELGKIRGGLGGAGAASSICLWNFDGSKEDMKMFEIEIALAKHYSNFWNYRRVSKNGF